MKEHRKQPYPPLQPLLFGEVCLLICAAGMAAARFPLPAASFCALVVWIDARLRRPACCLLAIVCGVFGWWMATHAEPHIPETRPLWLKESLKTQQPVAVTGTVVWVRGLPDQRLQIILEQVGPERVASEKILPVRDVSEKPQFDTATKSEKHLEQTTGKPPEDSAEKQTAQEKEGEEVLPGKLVLTGPDDSSRPLPGQRLSATLFILPVRGFRNRDLGGFDDYWHRQGVFFQAWIRTLDIRVSGEPTFGAALREQVRQRVRAALETRPFSTPKGGGTAVLPALLFGDRSGLSSADMERINAAGLSHSLALSGQHLAVAGLGALALTGLLGLLVPGLLLRVPAACLMGLLSLPLAASYLWLGDAPPSLVRAALMLAAVCLLHGLPALIPSRFRVVRPTLTLLDTLFIAFGCMLLHNPLNLYDLGLQLSFSAVAGIALALPWLRGLCRRFSISPIALLRGTVPLSRRLANRTFQLFWLTLGCSVAAQLATMPFVLDIFGRSTLWFPLNLLWLPVLGVVVLPLSFFGLLFAVTGLEQIATLTLQLAALPCTALLDGLRWLQQHGMDCFIAPRPHWSAFLGLGCLAVGLALRVNRKGFSPAARRLLLAGTVFFAVGPLLWVHGFFSPRIALRVLDVGQGQAVLLEWPRHGRAIVDGGGLYSERFDTGRDILSQLLTANDLPRLDFIALSHPDRDHLKGLLFIAEKYAFKAAYTAPLEGLDGQGQLRPLVADFSEKLERRGIPRKSLHGGERLQLGSGLVLQVLAPPAGFIPTGNDGLILRLTRHGHGLALLPGDAEKPYLRALLHSGADLSAEILVLPHHGSAANLLPEFYEAVSPRLAIASAGSYNRYRLPSQAVREELARRGIPLRVTGEEGEIAICWEAD